MNRELLSQGHILIDYPYAMELLPLVKNKDYQALDKLFQNDSKLDGKLNIFLQTFYPFNFLEHILAIRTPPDDDGIWHDDGSRHFGFSLSLNLDHENIEGGELLIRHKKLMVEKKYYPQPFGKMIIFLSGEFDFEHKVNEVTKGSRFIAAGWGSKAPFRD
jgi:hypothetical protein